MKPGIKALEPRTIFFENRSSLESQSLSLTANIIISFGPPPFPFLYNSARKPNYYHLFVFPTETERNEEVIVLGKMILDKSCRIRNSQVEKHFLSQILIMSYRITCATIFKVG